MKTLLNNLSAHIGYEDDGHLLHTDKRTAHRGSASRVGLILRAPRKLAAGLGKIEWEELKEPPPAA
jgi:hypothetical protein